MKKINVFYATVILAITSLVTYKLIKKGNIKVAKQFKPSNSLGVNKTVKKDLNVKTIEKRKYTALDLTGYSETEKQEKTYTILKEYTREEVKQPNN